MQKKSLVKNLWSGIGKRLLSMTTNPYNKVGLNWLQLKYYKHLPAGKLRKHKLFGNDVYFHSAQEFLYGLKEIFLEEVYKQNLSPQPFVIDCGANIGLSIIYMKQHFPDAEIIAFEPDEKNFALLTRNVSSFNFKHVDSRKEAVWIENTFLNFSNEGSMSSKIEADNRANSNKVKAVRLKDLLTRDVDFLKIDIEGAEYRVLTDIEEKLSLVKNLFLEYHGTFDQNRELTTIFDMLSANGFHYYIKEAAAIHEHPFLKRKSISTSYDIQLNIFCFRN